MVDWLSDVYGFEKRGIVKSENGEFQHAQLAFGDSMLAVVRVEDKKLERLVVHPDQIGGVETQTCYLVVPDIDAHFARATAKGAEIVSGIEGEHRGDRSYASRDPEGHIWIFGTYDPYGSRPRSSNDDNRRSRKGSLRAPLSALAVTGLVVSIVAGMWTYADTLAALKSDALRLAMENHSVPQGAVGDAKRLADQLLQLEAGREGVERKLARTLAALESALQNEKEARSLLLQEMRARETLARTASQSGDQLGQERIAREAAERTAKEATDQLGRMQIAKLAAERTARDVTDKCELERKSRALAEHSLQTAMAELSRERSTKAAAELAASELRNQLTALGATRPENSVFRDQALAERRAREKVERAAKDAQLQLTQEKYSRDATERALRQVEDRLRKAEDRLALASCWACPSGAPCARP
jgi:uncharacterized glyoxalase superfamily protein PhnB